MTISNSIYASRKIFMAVGLLAVAIVVMCVKGDVPPNFLTFLEVIFGAFVLGNGVEHVASVMTASAGSTSEEEKKE